MYLTSEIIAKLESMGISPKKSLGQNFLVSKGAIQKIMKAVKDLEPTNLIEVGPGLGSLTESLIGFEIPLTLIELDRVFCEYWRQRGLEVNEVDALRWDWSQITDKKHTVLVSNLPYQISSTLVVEQSIQQEPLSGMVLMFQKEVAQRLVAKPRAEDYGFLSVMAQNFWKIEFVLEAGPKDFYPPPRVASQVLRFRARTDFEGSRKDFLKVVKAGFAQRRKFLISNLKALGGYATGDNLRVLFDTLNLSHQVRAEELTIEQWRVLARTIYEQRPTLT